MLSNMLIFNTLFYLFYFGNSINWTNTNMSYFGIVFIIYIIELSKILH